MSLLLCSIHDCWNSNKQISTVKPNDYFVLSLWRHGYVMVVCCHHGCLVVEKQDLDPQAIIHLSIWLLVYNSIVCYDYEKVYIALLHYICELYWKAYQWEVKSKEVSIHQGNPYIFIKYYSAWTFQYYLN